MAVEEDRRIIAELDTRDVDRVPADRNAVPPGKAKNLLLEDEPSRRKASENPNSEQEQISG